MSDQLEQINQDSDNSLLNTAFDAVTDLITGSSIPTPIKKNVFKAFGQLCSAAIDVPVALLEGVAAEKRAETQARVKIISTGADQIIKHMDVDPEYARVAVKKYGQKIVREQVNLDKISGIAAQQIHQDVMNLPLKPSDIKDIPPINEDWLNNFERKASQKSTEEMQILFGRILAGEIQKPSSFSMKTVKLIGELDSTTANLFRDFCSLCLSIKLSDTSIVDARVVSLGGNAGMNSLQSYGLSFDQLNVLHEYGLIISDYNSWRDYQFSIAENYQVSLPFSYQNRNYGLVPLTERSNNQELKLSGVALSLSGQQLLNIVDIKDSEEYTKALTQYFTSQNLQMVEISN